MSQKKEEKTLIRFSQFLNPTMGNRFFTFIVVSLKTARIFEQYLLQINHFIYIFL